MDCFVFQRFFQLARREMLQEEFFIAHVLPIFPLIDTPLKLKWEHVIHPAKIYFALWISYLIELIKMTGQIKTTNLKTVFPKGTFEDVVIV